MNQTMLAEVFIAAFGGGALLHFVEFLITRSDQKAKETPEQKMLRALGADRLGVLLRDWLHADVRLANDWEIIDNLFEGYEALGGNGEIHKLYDEAKEIPTTE